MTVPVRLIKNVSPVQRGWPPRRKTPNIAVVYATASGQLFGFEDWRPMTYREQLTTKYRTRYDVDLSDHRRRAYIQSTPMPSRGDYYFFITDVDVGFRVHDPREIVRRNVTDPTKIVYTHLVTEFRKITRRFDIEDSELAEAAIATRFDVDEVLPDGITIFFVAPRLLPDEPAREYLKKKKEAEREVLTNIATHKVALQEARQGGELERLDREFQREQVKVEMQALQGRQLDVYEIVRRHLARHPDDTGRAMELLNEHKRAWLEHQDLYNRRTTDLFQSILDKDLIQPADVETLLPQMLSQVRVVPPPVTVEAVVGADWIEPPVLPSDETQNAEIIDDTPARGWTPADGVRPVYVLVDESRDALTDLGLLNAGLPRLLATAADDDLAPAIRLAVLGYADHLTVRLPLSRIGAGTDIPALSGGDAASYAAMFEALGERIDQDLNDLTRESSPVYDPVVFLLAASAASAATDNWAEPRQRLANPDLHNHIPSIVPFGIGGATRDMVTGIATDRAAAYLAAPGTDLDTAIGYFWDYVIGYLRDLTRRRADDRPPPDVLAPEGFRAAGEDR